MAMDPAMVADMIREALPGAIVEVRSDDGHHFFATVTAEAFRGKNRVQQHQMVYAALKGRMDGPAGELHALALQTGVPE